MAQINRFGGNISRTAAFIGMERSALHRKLKSLGVGSAQSLTPAIRRADEEMERQPRARRAASPMSMAAICRMPRPACISRTAPCSWATASMKSAACAGRQADRRRTASGPHGTLACAKWAWPCRWARAALKLVMREMVRAQPDARRPALSAGHARRGAPRSSHSRYGPRPTLIMTVRGPGPGARWQRRWRRASRSSPGRTSAGRGCDIKTVQLLAQSSGQDRRPHRPAPIEAWLVDGEGFVTEGASTNAWIVDQRRHVVTRELTHAILPGVTRRVILEAAAAAQLPMVERKFTVAEALAARGGLPVLGHRGGDPGGGNRRSEDRRRHAGPADPADPRCSMPKRGIENRPDSGVFISFAIAAIRLC